MLTMPFKKDDVKTKEWAKMGARKGYEYEEEQLERMRKLLNKYIDLAEKGLLDAKEREHFLRMEKLVLKAMDKLHPSKSDVKIQEEVPIMILRKNPFLDKNV